MISRKQVNDEIVSLEKQLELTKSLEHLKTDKQFEKLITKEYLQNYPLMLVNRLGRLQKDSAEYNEVVAELDAISRLDNYLQNIINQGQLATHSLMDVKSIPDSEIYDE